MTIRLRQWRKEDYSALSRNANNENVSRYLRDMFPYPYTEDDAKSFIEFATNCNNGNLYFAVTVDGEVAGGANIGFLDDVYRHNAGIGYWLGEKYWGKGIATEVIGKLYKKACKKEGIIRVEAQIIADNCGSFRALRKNGFVVEACLHDRIYKGGNTYDEILLVKRK